MENQNEIVEVVEQGSSKKGLIAKIAIGVVGAAALVGGALFLRKKKLEKLENDEVMVDVSVDESDEN